MSVFVCIYKYRISLHTYIGHEDISTLLRGKAFVYGHSLPHQHSSQEEPNPLIDSPSSGLHASGSQNVSGPNDVPKGNEETLSDLYPCLLRHQQISGKDTQTNKEKVNSLTLSLSGMMETLTPATCVQLAMLLCTDVSIIMVSLSPSLVSATLAVLPLLIKPFRMDISHVKQHIETSEDLDSWWDRYQEQERKSQKSRTRARGTSSVSSRTSGRRASFASSSSRFYIPSSSLSSSHRHCHHH